MFEEQLRALYKARGMCQWYASDLEADIQRMHVMPDETFLVVATQTSSDAVPILVNQGAQSFMRSVLEVRGRHQQDVCVFEVVPSKAKVREMTPEEGKAWLNRHPPIYTLERGVLLKSGIRIGVFQTRETINQMAGGQRTVFWSYTPDTRSGERSDAWLAMFTACAFEHYGPFVRVCKDEPVAQAA